MCRTNIIEKKLTEVEKNRHKFDIDLIDHANRINSTLNNVVSTIDDIKANFDSVVCSIINRFLAE